MLDLTKDGDPYRVAVYTREQCVVVAAGFKWYWAANMFSWFMHHVCGYGCRTYKKD